MTEIEIHQGSTLALTSEQTFWNDSQLAALRHMGVEGASRGDLDVFHHVCQRTGLDPFARQIHMIGRNTKDQRTNQWVTKYTIQTGIDGFRLIGRRAADAKHQTISIGAPQWAHQDGSWRDVWTPAWGLPIAARVTILRNGEPFAAVALFDEYKQTKKDGNLTSMWAQRPAGQLAKCAEALAWRMAFPQDLSGLYTDDEMGQADRPAPVEAQQQPTSAPDRMRGILGATGPEPEADTETGEVIDAEIVEPSDPIQKNQLTKLQILLKEVGLTDRDEALAYYARVTGREVDSSKALSRNEAGQVLDDLERVQKGEPNLLDPAPANDPSLPLDES